MTAIFTQTGRPLFKKLQMAGVEADPTEEADPLCAYLEGQQVFQPGYQPGCL